jgi:hypothetical protein
MDAVVVIAMDETVGGTLVGLELDDPPQAVAATSNASTHIRFNIGRFRPSIP